MSQVGINFYYTGVLGLNQNNLKVFYDFQSGVEDHILSVPVGNAENSGEIFGNTGNFFGDMGSGNFTDSYVKIQNTTGISPINSTFIVTQEKTGAEGGTIFSNFQGGNYKSGFHFGINDANKFYWGYQNGSSPIIKTSLKNLSDKNAWAVKLEDNNVSFSYYNNNTLRLEKESWSIDTNALLASDQWYLGSGINQKPYNDYLDNFIFVNQSIPDSSLTRLFSGLWNTSSGNFTGYLPYQTGQITGYTNVLTGITGVLDVTSEFSGFSTGQNEIEVYQFLPLTGNVSINDTELVFLQNLPQFCSNREEVPIYWEQTVTANGTGITGYQRVLSGLRTGEVVSEVYQDVTTTGFISSGTVLSPLYNTGNGNDILYSGSISTISDYDYLNSFGMSSVKYIGSPATGIFESLALTGVPLRDYFNKIGDYDFGSLKYSFSVERPSGSTNIYHDGLLKHESGYLETGEFFDVGILPISDYYTSGKFYDFAFMEDVNDIVIYDTNYSGTSYKFGGFNPVTYSGATVLYSGEIVYYSDTGNYSSSGTLPVSVYDKLFFFSGAKLVSGLHYTGVNGLFSPTPAIQSGRGGVLAIDVRDDQFYLTNEFSGISGRLTGNNFLRDTSINWSNGVRIDKGGFVEHGLSSDLLGHEQVQFYGASGFFTNNTDFWD